MYVRLHKSNSGSDEIWNWVSDLQAKQKTNTPNKMPCFLALLLLGNLKRLWKQRSGISFFWNLLLTHSHNQQWSFDFFFKSLLLTKAKIELGNYVFELRTLCVNLYHMNRPVITSVLSLYSRKTYYLIKICKICMHKILSIHYSSKFLGLVRLF